MRRRIEVSLNRCPCRNSLVNLDLAEPFAQNDATCPPEKKRHPHRFALTRTQKISNLIESRRRGEVKMMCFSPISFFQCSSDFNQEQDVGGTILNLMRSYWARQNNE